MIPGGGEYRVVTPDGEVVGSLDARFAHRTEPGNFTLGGATWSVVKCDESHNLVVVVPGGHNKGISRVFWSAGGEAALSPVICGAVQRIIARGELTFPLARPMRRHSAKRSVRFLPASANRASLSGRNEGMPARRSWCTPLPAAG